jgi:hypothetical protein
MKEFFLEIWGVAKGSISKLQKYFWEPPEAYMLPSILLMNLQP